VVTSAKDSSSWTTQQASSGYDSTARIKQASSGYDSTARIDELRTFEREYRTHLKTYLASQLRELDGRGSAAPADPLLYQQALVTSGSGAHADTRR
jgi:hypothetical protein